MERVELNNENYHSTEARKSFMGYSQFKNFLTCEKEALARVNGEIEDKKTPALLFGSYIDNYFSKEVPMERFEAEHQEMFTKQGTLKSDFKNIEKVIKTIENDDMLMRYLNGEHQVIMTGEIAGVPFKIKIDSYHPGKLIVDQKVMKDVAPVWIETKDKEGRTRNVKVNFVEAYRYDLEGAIYQEIVRQNTGLKLPFVLAITTKEEEPDKYLVKIDQEDLDNALLEVIEKAPRFDAIKKGEIEPSECGVCATCKKDKKITGVFSYHMFDPYKESE
jgi:hypothetical protein